VNPTRILLVDDHALLREGVGLLLRRLDPDIVFMEAGTLAEALERVAAPEALDLLLLDLGLPDGMGVEAIGAVHERRPGLPVVVLSAQDDRETVVSAIAAGAVGYVPKASSADVMLAGLRVVLGHGVYLPSSARMGEARQLDTPDALTADPTADLTPRQKQVLRLILRGMPIKAIARALDISTSTAKAHTAVILRALNVTTRTQAVVEASRLGLRFGPDGDAAPDAATSNS
jgi:DNA-binding NarL/FixJ family response regulator